MKWGKETSAILNLLKNKSKSPLECKNQIRLNHSDCGNCGVSMGSVLLQGLKSRFAALTTWREMLGNIKDWKGYKYQRGGIRFHLDTWNTSSSGWQRNATKSQLRWLCATVCGSVCGTSLCLNKHMYLYTQCTEIDSRAVAPSKAGQSITS